MGIAVQTGDKIIISNEFGSISRSYNGLLISYKDGYLTYIPTNGGRCIIYVGI